MILKYNNKHTWMNYWYQINSVLLSKPENVLEIKPGTGVVTENLKKNGVEVVTVDIDETLQPDVVTSVESLPFENDCFDIVLCSEVLEHLPYDRFVPALKEISRVSRKIVILGLPNAGGVFKLVIKIPFLKEIALFTKLPFFWKEHHFNGEHYWETGKRGYSLTSIEKEIKAVGLNIVKRNICHDDPAHCFFILQK